MTSRERFHAMMSGGRPDRLPLDLPMTEPVAEEMQRRLGHRDTHHLGADFGYVGPEWEDRSAAWQAAYAGIGFQLPPNGFVGGDGYVGENARPGSLGAAWHLSAMLHPLETVTEVSQLDGMPWERPHPQAYADLPQRTQEIHARGLVSVIGLECTVFEAAWYRRGMDQLFVDLAEEDPVGVWLLDFFTERSAASAEAAARAGVDLIRLGDDVGTQRGMMMSVQHWRKWFKPRLAEVIARARAASSWPWIQYHSDGNIADILDDLVEIGVQVLNPVQPECMDLEATFRRYGRRLAFSGMIGTQTTMPFGTPAAVRAAVAHLREWAVRGVRMIVAPTHVLEPDVPWSNIEALVASACTPLTYQTSAENAP